MKYFLILLISLLSFSLQSQTYPISEKKAISLITENHMFKVYNEYLKKKYNVNKTYKILIKELSFEDNEQNTVYCITVLNLIKDIQNGDVIFIDFNVNVFTGKVEIVQPIFIQNEELRIGKENIENLLNESLQK